MNATEWRNVIDKALDEDENDTPDSVETNAQDWFCCAVGSKLQKDLNLENINDEDTTINANEFLMECLTSRAKLLGTRFYEAINGNDYVMAKHLFEKVHSMKIEDIVKDGKYDEVADAFMHCDNIEYYNG